VGVVLPLLALADTFDSDKVIYSPVGLRWLSKILGKAEVWLESGSALGDNRFELA
jgi:hypothetical protein